MSLLRLPVPPLRAILECITAYFMRCLSAQPCRWKDRPLPETLASRQVRVQMRTSSISIAHFTSRMLSRLWRKQDSRPGLLACSGEPNKPTLNGQLHSCFVRSRRPTHERKHPQRQDVHERNKDEQAPPAAMPGATYDSRRVPTHNPGGLPQAAIHPRRRAPCCFVAHRGS